MHVWSLATRKMPTPDVPCIFCLSRPPVHIPERSAAVQQSGKPKALTAQGPGRNKPRAESA